MSATNATTYYELPVFIATDKPAWLTDWNGAMNAIDTAIKEALTAGENAQTTANTATTSIATINDSLTTINTSLTTLTSTVTGLVGSVNTINSLIGNGEPTTSDKTLIGAINEIYAMIGGGSDVEADIVVYDNTTSGLTATNVQDAIDELATAPAPSAGLDFGTATILTITADATNTTSSTGSISYATSNEGKFAKIYGGVTFGLNAPSAATNDVKLASLNTAFTGITSAFDMVVGYSLCRYSWSNQYLMLSLPTKLHINTDGTADITADLPADLVGTTYITLYVSLVPCIYEIIDLGD